MAGLSRYEQEVTIGFNAEEGTAELYTADPVWMRKLDKLVEHNLEQFKMYRQEKMDGRVISKEYRFPKRFVSIRSKDKTSCMTEEHKQGSGGAVETEKRRAVISILR